MASNEKKKGYKPKSGDTIATDLDGCLAMIIQEPYLGPLVIGEPIPEHLDRVKGWLKEGIVVVIFTARITVEDPMLKGQIIMAIQAWSKKHIGKIIEITNIKRGHWVQNWDDHTIRLITNTGIVFDGKDDQA